MNEKRKEGHNMLVCTRHKKELVCRKNGFGLRWTNRWTYSGDLYACPEPGCETAVVLANTEGWDDPGHNYLALDMQTPPAPNEVQQLLTPS